MLGYSVTFHDIFQHRETMDEDAEFPAGVGENPILVTLPVTPWPDWYRSSVARPQVFIDCAVTTTQHTLLSRWKGAPFGVWRRQCLENHRHRLEAEEPISWVPRDLEILCPRRPLCHQPKKLRMCPASLRAPWPGLCSGEPLRFARCQDGWEQEGLPSGKRLHNYWKSPFLMGKLTINHHFQ